jgi:hypothetical protein
MTGRTPSIAPAAGQAPKAAADQPLEVECWRELDQLVLRTLEEEAILEEDLIERRWLREWITESEPS